VARLLRHDPGVRIGDDPEDVHQARVATRRLRSDLRTFRPLLDQAQAEPLRAELKWVADLLGDNRDADVLTEHLRKHADRLPQRDAGAVAALLRRLVAQRDDARTRLLEGIRSERYVALTECLVAFAQVPPLVGRWAEPAGDVLPDLVAPAWRHLSKAVADLGPEPRAEDLHAIRIKAKRFRYAAEAVAPAVGKDAARLASAVADVQSLLGDHHDAHVAEGWLRDTASTADAASALAAGELIAIQRLEAEDLERRWPGTWKKASQRKLRRWLD
jgi:CHAD domain-containing protein